MGDTTISWTNKTWNPIRGCSRVSEGCRNCYAERVAARFSGPGQPYEGLARIKTTIANNEERDPGNKRSARWTGVVRLIPEHLADPLRWKKPRRVFVNSMSDLFHESLTNEQIAAVFGVMAAAPQHTFQILTKRARRMREWFAWVGSLDEDTWTECHAAALAMDADDTIHTRSGEAPGRPWPLPNVWLGVSVENQEAADERIPELLRTPAAVRFLSCEPLIGPVGLGPWVFDRERAVRHMMDVGLNPDQADDYVKPMLIDWVIAGCESGPGARECKVEWLRSLRDQCAAARVPYFLKQAFSSTSRTDNSVRHGDGSKFKNRNGTGADRGGHRALIELPYLDGVQHAAFPEVAP